MADWIGKQLSMYWKTINNNEKAVKDSSKSMHQFVTVQPPLKLSGWKQLRLNISSEVLCVKLYFKATSFLKEESFLLQKNKQREKVLSVNTETVSESPEKKHYDRTPFTLITIKNKEWFDFNPLDWRSDSTYRLKIHFKAF